MVAQVLWVLYHQGFGKWFGDYGGRQEFSLDFWI